jgi:hypothetical protein
MDVTDSVRQKVNTIFHEMAGDRAEKLNWIAKDVIARIKGIYKKKYGPHVASTLGMHMTDWNYDAAFIVALCLFPERFTDEEIDAGVGMFLIHAPNHIRAACQITDTYVWKDFQMMTLNLGRTPPTLRIHETAFRSKNPFATFHTGPAPMMTSKSPGRQIASSCSTIASNG